VLAVRDLWPWWLAALVAARVVLLTAGGTILLRSGRAERTLLTGQSLGRPAVAATMGCMVLAVLSWTLGEAAAAARPWVAGACAAAALLLLCSLGEKILLFVGVLRGRAKAGAQPSSAR